MYKESAINELIDAVKFWLKSREEGNNNDDYAYMKFREALSKLETGVL